MIQQSYEHGALLQEMRLLTEYGIIAYDLTKNMPAWRCLVPVET